MFPTGHGNCVCVLITHSYIHPHRHRRSIQFHLLTHDLLECGLLTIWEMECTEISGIILHIKFLCSFHCLVGNRLRFMDVLHDVKHFVILQVGCQNNMSRQLMHPTKLFMLHYLSVNKVCSSVSEFRQAVQFKNIYVKHHRPPEAPSVLTEIILPLNATSKVLMLELPVSKTGQERQKCICKAMKYWVCFDYELSLTSLTSCDLAEILMRWDSFYSHFACLPNFWFSANNLEDDWKKALLSLVNWPELTPQFNLVGRQG